MSQTSKEKPIHYHFMGIGGIGMSGLALMMQKRGAMVSGCDNNRHETVRMLEQHGIEVNVPHDASHAKNLDVLVASTAIGDNHPELMAALAAGKQVMRRIELLGELMAESIGIGITGTHGKTTTSAMTSAIFHRAGLDPRCAVGGFVADIGGNYRLGAGQHFIAEIDESDPLFQNLKLQVALIHNLENDHVAPAGHGRKNYHNSYSELVEAFANYSHNCATLFYNADWPGLEEVTQAAKNRISYGIENGDYRAEQVRLETGSGQFTLTLNGAGLCSLTVPMPGKHNIMNALAAASVAHHAGVPLVAIENALANFAGVGRRWEHLGDFNGAKIIDDYAHNPTKVAAAIAAGKQSGLKVRVVFQPHRYGRTATEWMRYSEVLKDADEVLILDIYGAGEEPIPGVHAEAIAKRMQELGHTAVRYDANRETTLSYLKETAVAGDLILTLGAGDVYKLGASLVAKNV